MTIDERLEAITHNIEILMGMQMANERRFTLITENFEKAHDSIKRLENIAAAHEERLDDLEGGQ